MEETILHQPTQLDRLGQFAVSHFVLSFVSVAVVAPIGLLLVHFVSAFEVLLAIEAAVVFVLMLAYGFAGIRAARVCSWEKPNNTKAGFLAFLFPTLIAWGWGSLVLCCCFLSGAWSGLGLLLAAGSLIAAFPSSLAVLFSLGVGFLDGGVLNMIVCILLVGGLPPLLFLLGSLWGSRRNEIKQ